MVGLHQCTFFTSVINVGRIYLRNATLLKWRPKCMNDRSRLSIIEYSVSFNDNNTGMSNLRSFVNSHVSTRQSLLYLPLSRTWARTLRSRALQYSTRKWICVYKPRKKGFFQALLLSKDTSLKDSYVVFIKKLLCWNFRCSAVCSISKI